MRYLNYESTQPDAIKPGNYRGLKLIAQAKKNGHYDVCVGPTDWTDWDVFRYGRKLSSKQANNLIYALHLSHKDRALEGQRR